MGWIAPKKWAEPTPKEYGLDSPKERIWAGQPTPKEYGLDSFKERIWAGAKAMGIKNNEERNKDKPKADKWAQLSEIGDKTKAGEIEEKLIKIQNRNFQKDMAALDAGAFALNKQNGEKVLLKNVKLENKKGF